MAGNMTFRISKDAKGKFQSAPIVVLIFLSIVIISIYSMSQAESIPEAPALEMQSHLARKGSFVKLQNISTVAGKGLEALVTDQNGACVFIWSAADNSTTEFAGKCGEAGETMSETPAELRLNAPSAAAAYGGSLDLAAIADRKNDRIIIIENGKARAVQFALTGEYATRIFSARGVVDLEFADKSTLFMADAQNHTVYEADLTTYKLKPTAGSGVTALDDFTASADNASRSSPAGISLYKMNGGDMRLYIAEADGRMLRLLVYEDARLTIVAGNPRSNPDDFVKTVSPAMLAVFRRPFRVSASSFGDACLITDPSANRLYYYSIFYGYVYALQTGGMDAKESAYSAAFDATGRVAFIGTNAGLYAYRIVKSAK